MLDFSQPIKILRTSKRGGGAQRVNDEIFEILQQKSPKSSKAVDEAFLKETHSRSISCYW